MKAATLVLYEKVSMSSVTFLMSLWRVLRLALVGVSSLTAHCPSRVKKRFHVLRRKRKQPSMPLLSQGLLWLMGPRNISYRRRVSAPYFSMMTSGLTTLYIDFDIFSTAQPQM